MRTSISGLAVFALACTCLLAAGAGDASAQDVLAGFDLYETNHYDALANVVVAVRNGKPLLMSDVAEVVIDHQPMVGDGIINDDIGLLLIVEKFIQRSFFK